MSVALQVDGVSKAYRDGERSIEVLRRVDLDVEAGDLVAIVGPSGSGKSTLLHLIGALDRPDQGRVVIDGRDLTRLPTGELATFRNRTVGFVFQFHQLLPDFTALENVALPGRIAGQKPEACFAKAERLLAAVGLGDRASHFPSQLSGGECQRVAICRALLLEPALVLADEPTGNLDPESGEGIFQLLLDLHRSGRTTTLLVTHNPELARRCAKIFRLEQGILKPVQIVDLPGT